MKLLKYLVTGIVFSFGSLTLIDLAGKLMNLLNGVVLYFFPNLSLNTQMFLMLPIGLTAIGFVVDKILGKLKKV